LDLLPALRATGGRADDRFAEGDTVDAYIKKASDRQAEEEGDQDFNSIDRHLSPSDTRPDPQRPVLVKLPRREMNVGSNEAFPTCALESRPPEAELISPSIIYQDASLVQPPF
jgi:hypothetical protein